MGIANQLSILALLFFTISCSSPTLQTHGGSQITLEFSHPTNSIKPEVILAIKERLSNLTAYPEAITTSTSGDLLIVEIPTVTDTTSVKKLLEWDRSMKLSYAIEKSSYLKLRSELSDYIESPTQNKPYKAFSLIGLVNKNNKHTIDSLMLSSELKQMFPEIGKHYWGVEPMENKSALFVESKTTPFINESMFEKIEAFETQEGEGILSLKLKTDFQDRIGQLTGNDSTYLLHIFHEEVYISKIIKPHITEIDFSMSGAFTPQEALVLASLWNSKNLPEPLRVQKMELID